jgi:GNAT superfamily N-acetyltransferase
MRRDEIERIEIATFGAEHLDTAAALLASRHRRDREREPELPPRFEAPGAARALLETRLRRPRSAGVAAMRRGCLVGYLLGATFVTPPASRSFLAPRAGFIGCADHAVESVDAIGIHSALYGALAPGWLDAGCLSHHVQVAATDPRIEELWHAVGFGRQFTTAIRDTSAPAAAGWSGDVRRAGPEDLDTVMGFIDGLHRFEAAAPMWRPYLPETPEERTIQAQRLADPACACWIASQDGRPLAIQSFQPPPPFLSPLIVPDRSIYLLVGYTEPAARHAGIGTRLLASAMAWAREAGHEHCLLHITAGNQASTGFWLRHGFRPVEYWLGRRLDERIGSAGGSREASTT